MFSTLIIYVVATVVQLQRPPGWPLALLSSPLAKQAMFQHESKLKRIALTLRPSKVAVRHKNPNSTAVKRPDGPRLIQYVIHDFQSSPTDPFPLKDFKPIESFRVSCREAKSTRLDRGQRLEIG